MRRGVDSVYLLFGLLVVLGFLVFLSVGNFKSSGNYIINSGDFLGEEWTADVGEEVNPPSSNYFEIVQYYSYERGDFNEDGVVDDKDLQIFADYGFNGGEVPEPFGLADLNYDNTFDVSDFLLMSGYLNVKDTFYLPLYRRGDVNRDGFVNIDDRDFLSKYMFESGSSAPSPIALADVNFDGVVDVDDFNFLNEELVMGGKTGELYRPGDVNRDGLVNDLDIDFLTDYLFYGGEPPNPFGLGDVNLDLIVDLSDLLLVSEYLYGESSQGFYDFIRMGDVNVDGFVNQVDVDFLTDYSFNGGEAPAFTTLADVNEDGLIDFGDATLLSEHLLGVTDIPLLKYRLGDVNKDGHVDTGDVDFLSDVMFRGGSIETQSLADVNLDGVMDIDDLNYLVDFVSGNLPAPGDSILLGDVNHDFVVNGADRDYLVAYQNQGGDVLLPWVAGDVNSDGAVDVSDSLAISDFLNGQEIFTPEYISRGDVYLDGVLSQEDVDFLNGYIFSGSNSPRPLGLADVNLDGVVDVGDVLALNERVNFRGNAPYSFLKRGDINKDNVLDENDVDILLEYIFNFGRAPEPLGIGDVDLDGVVDTSDILFLSEIVGVSSDIGDLDCDPNIDVNYICEGTTAYLCSEEGTWVNHGQIEGVCGYTSGSGDEGGSPGGSTRPDPVIHSPKDLIYSKTKIPLIVEDENDVAVYWQYSLNTGDRIDFDADEDSFIEVSGEGDYNLVVYASRYSSFSNSESASVKFGVVFPATSTVVCGDNYCGYGESCLSCEEDCGECTYTNTGAYGECGDGICEDSEDKFLCPVDCGDGSSKSWWWVLIAALIVAGILTVIILIMKRTSLKKFFNKR